MEKPTPEELQAIDDALFRMSLEENGRLQEKVANLRSRVVQLDCELNIANSLIEAMRVKV